MEKKNLYDILYLASNSTYALLVQVITNIK